MRLKINTPEIWKSVYPHYTLVRSTISRKLVHLKDFFLFSFLQTLCQEFEALAEATDIFQMLLIRLPLGSNLRLEMYPVTTEAQK